MSDTPDKKDTAPKESAETPEKTSPWFVTPMGDKPGQKESKDAASERPEKTAEEEKPAASPTPKPVTVAPTPKAAAPAPTTANPFTDTTITFDDEKKTEAVSVPMLVIDGLAAAVAIAFTVMILRDVMPFL